MPGRRLALTATALLVLLAACGGGGSAAGVTPPPEANMTIDARDFRFDREELDAASGEGGKLFFRNLDGSPHNVAIYADASASDPIFVGETINDASVLYELPALEAGTYYFRCDVHPEMDGTFVVK